MINRRRFLRWGVAASAAALAWPRRVFGAARPAPASAAPPDPARPAQGGGHSPVRIPNEYALLLPGDAEALAGAPRVSRIQPTSAVVLDGQRRARARRRTGGGWLAVGRDPAGAEPRPTAVLERHAAHRGVIVYLTEAGEVAAHPERRRRPGEHPATAGGAAARRALHAAGHVSGAAGSARRLSPRLERRFLLRERGGARRRVHRLDASSPNEEAGPERSV